MTVGVMTLGVVVLVVSVAPGIPCSPTQRVQQQQCVLSIYHQIAFETRGPRTTYFEVFLSSGEAKSRKNVPPTGLRRNHQCTGRVQCTGI